MLSHCQAELRILSETRKDFYTVLYLYEVLRADRAARIYPACLYLC